jgi:hypothetical protein
MLQGSLRESRIWTHAVGMLLTEAGSRRTEISINEEIVT